MAINNSYRMDGPSQVDHVQARENLRDRMLTQLVVSANLILAQTLKSETKDMVEEVIKGNNEVLKDFYTFLKS